MGPGDLIRRRRVAAGVTQEQLAIRAGTTKTAISRLEAGGVSPTLATIERLLLCLGYRLELDTVPLRPRADEGQLAAVAGLTPTERLEHGLKSQAGLASLLGAARDR